MVYYNSFWESLYIHQIQVKRYCKISEDWQTQAQCDGVDGQDVFINETRCHKAPHKSRAANCYNRFPRLGFEFPDPFGKIAIENTRPNPGSRGRRQLRICRIPRIDSFKSF